MSKRNPPGEPVVQDPHEVNVDIEGINQQMHDKQAYHMQIQPPTMPGEEGTIDGRSSGPKSVLEAQLPDGTVDRTIVPSALNAPVSHEDHTPWSKANEAGLVSPGAAPEGQNAKDLKEKVEALNPDGAPDGGASKAPPAQQGPSATSTGATPAAAKSVEAAKADAKK